MLAVVSDVGGTHARFGVADLSLPIPAVEAPSTLLCRDYATYEAALTVYSSQRGLEHLPDHVAVAIAGPVINGEARLTNAAWQVSEAGLREFGFRSAAVMNDFGAMALGAPCLTNADARWIGPQQDGRPDKPMSVLGPGTGFGAAVLTPTAAGQTLTETEAGHIAFAPTDEVEAKVWEILRRRFGRVSVERLLSGPGLVNLHLALREIAGRPADCAAPSDITDKARAGDPDAVETLARFCAILGSTAGDLALAHGAQGGVCIAGGIAPRLLSVLEQGGFRDRFEDKGRFRTYLAAVPTRVALHPYLALIGAARQLQIQLMLR